MSIWSKLQKREFNWKSASCRELLSSPNLTSNDSIFQLRPDVGADVFYNMRSQTFLLLHQDYGLRNTCQKSPPHFRNDNET